MSRPRLWQTTYAVDSASSSHCPARCPACCSAPGNSWTFGQNGSMSESSILATIAIVMSGISLSWQAVTWVRSGPVVTVAGDWDSSGNPGFTVRNRGRAPVTVNEWGLRHGQIRIRLPEGLVRESPPLPHRLDQGASATWRIEQGAFKGFCNAQSLDERQLVPFVSLASGKTVRARYPGFWPELPSRRRG